MSDTVEWQHFEPATLERQRAALEQRGQRWLAEPLDDWLTDRWAHGTRQFDYLLEGADRASFVVTKRSG